MKKSAKYILHFSGFKNKDSTTPRLLAGKSPFPCPTTSQNVASFLLEATDILGETRGHLLLGPLLRSSHSELGAEPMERGNTVPCRGGLVVAMAAGGC